MLTLSLTNCEKTDYDGQNTNVNSDVNVITTSVSHSETTASAKITYILNTNTNKFHYPDCPSVDQMSDKNKREYTGDRDSLISRGYSPCKKCNP